MNLLGNSNIIKLYLFQITRIEIMMRENNNDDWKNLLKVVKNKKITITGRHLEVCIVINIIGKVG